MEELNLKKAIKELKKQIKKQEERVFNASKKLDEQKEKDEREKQFQYGKIDNKIDSAVARQKKAGKSKKISGIIAGASLLSAMFISPALVVIFQNLWWLSLVWLGASLSILFPSFSIWAKNMNKIEDEQKLMRNLYRAKDNIMLKKSNEFCNLEMEMDLEYEILKKLQNEYTVLLKYARKKEPKKIEKAKIEVKKAKSIKNEDLTK